MRRNNRGVRMMQEFKDRVKLGVSPSTTVTTLEAGEPMGLDELKEKLGDQLIAGGDEAQGDWITIKWHVDDVLDVREDLTREQAKEVLHKVGGNHDAEIGINWDVIEAWADNLYPDPERGGLVAMLNGEHNDE